LRKQLKRKHKLIVLGAIVALMLILRISAYAVSPHGGFSPADMQSPVNTSGVHAPVWERFEFSYYFTSGMDYRYDLGRPTTFDGFVPANVYTANIRRDAMVSLRPPAYGVFSGVIQTEQVSFFFPQPVNPNHWRPTVSTELENPNVIPRFDTLQMGVNAPNIGNPINMHNVEQNAVQQSTSLGGSDIVPVGGGGGMTRSFHISGSASPSGSASGMTTLGSSGFLPPTSITG